MNNQQLYAYRNENSFYKRTCDSCKKSVISIFHPASPHTVYCNECWWSDKWDPLSYGRDFDFTRPFFEQFAELLRKAPLVSLVIGDSENSDYTNYAMWNKNCYMVSSSDYNQDSLYSSYIFRCKDCSDCIFVSDSELVYESIDSKRCYSSAFLQNCSSCTDSLFCYDCRNCEKCIGCVDFRNKNLQIFNQPCTQEQFDEFRRKIVNHTAEFLHEFNNFKIKFPHKFAEIDNCVNSYGDNLIRSKNCQNCFDMVESQDCENCTLGIKARNCTDSIGVPDSELCHQVVGCPGNYDIKSSVLIWPKSSFLEYCLFCRTSNNCFGCVSLHKNQYCILNKQYSKENYEVMKNRIIEYMKNTGEYGRFFPIAISPFAYNETIAQDYFPLKKEAAISLGYGWADPDNRAEMVAGLPICTNCGKNYRLISQELALYEKIDFPVPQMCPECRRKRRMSARNPRALWDRNCMKCGVDIKSSFGPNRPEIVCCEKCHLDAVSG
ncbi:MAG: hypothetical protein UV80_C0002G0143 [Candidatus Peregrinibacteria bacterium GW2011_GWF2_43_17]|nr:MAG: hypothetical protein UV80_C0002G0143 [Candidatus Peregrinibacteria bacterium GW2011_GWF2_43_17]KKT19813.1 MAG: hypothetical protein UW03_C0013G0013 [Candidatus Peregrinibacteria bacterium GW2011_GWA2_43_8]HAU39813.1 hypothetical protein [Candidatus Peregrinibacteria bacterium]